MERFPLENTGFLKHPADPLGDGQRWASPRQVQRGVRDVDVIGGQRADVGSSCSAVIPASSGTPYSTRRSTCSGMVAPSPDPSG